MGGVAASARIFGARGADVPLSMCSADAGRSLPLTPCECPMVNPIIAEKRFALIRTTAPKQWHAKPSPMRSPRASRSERTYWSGEWAARLRATRPTRLRVRKTIWRWHGGIPAGSTA